MTKQVVRSAGERLEVRSGISQQRFEVSALMIMRDDAAADAPEPLNAIRIRVIGRRVDQRQLIGEFGQHAAHEQGPLSRMGLEIVGNDHRHTSTRSRTSHCRTHLLAKDISCASCRNPAIKPAIAPVHQPKAVHLPVIAWSFDEPLATPTLEAPEPSEGWMKGKLHLILQIEIGSCQPGQQFGHVGGKLTPQISLNQILDG